MALRLPWWTLRKSFKEVQEVAQLGGKTPEEVRKLLRTVVCICTERVC